VDFPRLAKRAEELLTHTALVIHAERLGLTPWTLRALRCGDYGGALGFPMVDARGEVIGVRLRTIDGKKICVKGSHNGLFIVREQEYCPWADPGHSALFIVEGGTNLAALCQIGLWGIGRPSCSCGVEMLCEYLSDYRGEIVVLRDNETKPAALAYSIPGAITLANALARHHKVRLATTPTKDLRDWVIAGATALAVLGLARNTMQWDAQTKG
jgi:hypothetical protein